MTGFGRFARKKAGKDDTSQPKQDSAPVPDKAHEGSFPAPTSQGFGALGSRPSTSNSEFLQFNISEQVMQFDHFPRVPESVAAEVQNGDEISKVTNFDEGASFDIGNLGANENNFDEFTANPNDSNGFASIEFSYNNQNENNYCNNEALFDTSQFSQNESDQFGGSFHENHDIKNIASSEKTEYKDNVDNNILTPTINNQNLSLAQKMRQRKQEQEQGRKIIQEEKNIEMESVVLDASMDIQKGSTLEQTQGSTKYIELSPSIVSKTTFIQVTDKNLPDPDLSVDKNPAQLSTEMKEYDNQNENMCDSYGESNPKSIAQNMEISEQNEKAENSDAFNAKLDHFTSDIMDQEQDKEVYQVEEMIDITATSPPFPNKATVDNRDKTKQKAPEIPIQKSSPASNIVNIEKNEQQKIIEVSEEIQGIESIRSSNEANRNMISMFHDQAKGSQQNTEKEIECNKIRQQNNDDTSLKQDITLSTHSSKIQSTDVGEEIFDIDSVHVPPLSKHLYAKTVSDTLLERQEEQTSPSSRQFQELKKVTQEKPHQAIDDSIKGNVKDSENSGSGQGIAEITTKKGNTDKCTISLSSYRNGGEGGKSESNLLGSRLHHSKNYSGRFEKTVIDENNTDVNVKSQHCEPFYENRVDHTKEKHSVAGNQKSADGLHHNQLLREESHTPPRSTFVKRSSVTEVVDKPVQKQKIHGENANSSLSLDRKTPQILKEANILAHGRMNPVHEEAHLDTNIIRQNELRHTLARSNENRVDHTEKEKHSVAGNQKSADGLHHNQLRREDSHTPPRSKFVTRSSVTEVVDKSVRKQKIYGENANPSLSLDRKTPQILKEAKILARGRMSPVREEAHLDTNIIRQNELRRTQAKSNENGVDHTEKEKHSVAGNQKSADGLYHNQLRREDSHTSPRSTFVKRPSGTEVVDKPVRQQKIHGENANPSLSLDRKTPQILEEANILARGRMNPVHEEAHLDTNIIRQNELRHTLARSNENRVDHTEKEKHSVAGNQKSADGLHHNQLAREDSHTPPRSKFVTRSSVTEVVDKSVRKQIIYGENANPSLSLDRKTPQILKEANILARGRMSPVREEARLDINIINQNELRRTQAKRKDSMKKPPAKEVVDKPACQLLHQDTARVHKGSTSLAHKRTSPAREELNLYTNGMNSNTFFSARETKMPSITENRKTESYNKQESELCQGMNYERRNSFDGNASFDVLQSKFLNSLRDTNDMLNKGDSEMLDLSIQLSHVHGVSLRYLGDMVDLLEEANEIISMGNDSISMFSP